MDRAPLGTGAVTTVPADSASQVDRGLPTFITKSHMWMIGGSIGGKDGDNLSYKIKSAQSLEHPSTSRMSQPGRDPRLQDKGRPRGCGGFFRTTTPHLE